MLSLDGGDVVVALQIKPELCAVPEITTESHGCIGGNGAATIEDVGDTAGRHPEIEGEPVCTEIARLQLALQEAARMGCERHGLTPVIINDLNIVGIALSLLEIDSMWIVHHDLSRKVVGDTGGEENFLRRLAIQGSGGKKQ